MFIVFCVGFETTTRVFEHWRGFFKRKFVRLERLNSFLRPAFGLMAMWPSAEAVRGWRRPNRSTVWTGARLRTGLGFYA
jgi:hypothetical protein